MFAPTVTGSPLVSAFRVIARHETSGRGYYSGIIGLVTADAGGVPSLDSAIVIRTATITADGQLTLSVGATLVRDSAPDDEVLETRAKAAGLISALSRRPLS
jgi:phenazine biosynthesis protein phzE